MRKIYEDVITNKHSGLLTKLLLVNFRIGQHLLIAKKRYGVAVWPLYLFPFIVLRLMSILFGCSVPFSTSIGRRVLFRHGFYGVFLSGNAIIGDDCEILHHVTIGSNIGVKPLSAPKIGNRFFIGVGAKIIGGIQVGNGCKIGAQALIVKDVLDNHTCLAPIAAIFKNQ